jgi:glycosyltransferase involved in cell wall biosynthesis
MSSSRRPVVSLVFKSLYQYRIAFCEQLRQRLDGLGMDLRVVHGQPGREDAAKQDSATLAWAHQLRNTVVPVGRRELFWQPALPALRGSDLVVVEVASKLLLNYVLLARQMLGGQRVAFLGHGFNARQRPGTTVGELVKDAMSVRVHWWFAYNRVSAEAVARLGYPAERITNIQNAIDTRALIEARSRVSPAQLDDLRRTIGLMGEHVGIFLGGMYADKLLPFLLEACRRIRHEIPDFEMIFMGAGPDQALVQSAAAELPWIHYVPPKFGADKVPYCLLAQVLLLPGAVGLAVLDSFALGLPLVTVEERFHGPELAYLEDGLNGVILPRVTEAADYASAVAGLLRDRDRLTLLRDGCAASSGMYTMEEMVRRFADGLSLAMNR